jgi:hypothetical protein
MQAKAISLDLLFYKDQEYVIICDMRAPQFSGYSKKAFAKIAASLKDYPLSVRTYLYTSNQKLKVATFHQANLRHELSGKVNFFFLFSFFFKPQYDLVFLLILKSKI